MNEVPEDIKKAATATYEGLPIVYDGWDEDAVIQCIARALLSERERCAKICEARLPLYTDVGQRNAVRECASSIRGSK